MFSNCALVILALSALAAATDVKQCPGSKFEGLKDLIELTHCNKPPCKLKKGTNQGIMITFTAEEDMADVKNQVYADVFGLDVPFVDVDKMSICDKLFKEDGEKAACPLTKGAKYVYKDEFPILSFYPDLTTRVHWALQHNDKDIICFEVPAQIKSNKR